MSGVDVVAVCTRIEDAEALSGYDHKAKKSYQIVAKMVDTVDYLCYIKL
jgi:hypothetical protein